MPFLRGREFSVSLLGSGAEARVLGTNEILYEAGSDFQGSDVELYGTRKARALGATTAAHGAGDGDADTDTDVIRGAAEALALEAWRAIGCRDAGRVDVRCQGTGEEDAQPMVLEINAMAHMRRQISCLPLTAAAAGMDYKTLIGGIVESAAQRAANGGS